VAASSGGSATVAAGVGAGWLMKVAAVAALSATPLLAGGEGSKPLHAASKASAHVTSTDRTFALHPRPPSRQVAYGGYDERPPTRPGATDTSKPDGGGGIADPVPVVPPAIDPTPVVGDPSDVGLPAAPAQPPAVVVTTVASPAGRLPTIEATVAIKSGTTSLEVGGLVAGPDSPALTSLPLQPAVPIPAVPATATVSATGAIAPPPGPLTPVGLPTAQFSPVTVVVDGSGHQ
jgi:hypothetical protein